jgi:hypothetical protein
MKKLVFALLLISPALLQSQAPSFEWIKTIAFPPGAALGSDLPSDLKVDAEGNTYWLCVFTQPLDFGAGIVLDPQSDNGPLCLAKFAPDGELAWARRIDDNATSVEPYSFSDVYLAVDTLNNVYVGGSFYAETIEFGNGVEIQLSCEDCTDLFLAQFNPDGQAVWARTATPAPDQDVTASAIAGAPDGSVYVYGSYEGPSLDFGPGFTFTGLPGESFFLAKYLPSGQVLWVKFPAGTTMVESADLMRIGSGGEIYLTGIYSEPLDLGNDVALDVFGNDESTNFYLALYNADGLALKAANLNTDDYLDMLDAEVDPDGRLHVILDFSGHVDTADSPLALGGNEEYTSLIVRYDGIEVVSGLRADYSSDTYPLLDLAFAPDGKLYTGGFIDAVPITIGTETVVAAGCTDGLILEANLESSPAGVVTWTKPVGGPGCEAITDNYYGQSIDTDPNGNLYVTGAFVDGLSIDGFSQNDDGMFVGKLPAGTVSTRPVEIETPRFSLLPNPAPGRCRIELRGDDGAGAQLEVFDQQGKRVYAAEVSASGQELKLDLPPGAYTALLRGKESASRQKLVVVKP